MRVLNAKQMRAVDRQTIDDLGLPSIVLMENAGRQVVAAMESLVDDLASRRVAVLCGTGNNGGDGFVVARTLQQRGVEVAVYVVGALADVRGDARQNLDVIGRLGLSIIELADAQAWELHGSQVTGAEVIVDAIVGTGLSRALSGLHETVVADVNAAAATVVAIDLPSGLSADTSELIGPVLEADLDRDAGGAEGAAGPAAGGTRRRGRRDCRHRHPARGRRPGRGSAAPPAHPRLGAGPGAPARARRPQGRLRPRPGRGRLARQDRRGGAGRPRGAAGAAPAWSPWRRRRGASRWWPSLGVEFMTVALDDTGDGVCDLPAVDQVLALEADVVAIGPGLGDRAGRRRLRPRGDRPL